MNTKSIDGDAWLALQEVCIIACWHFLQETKIPFKKFLILIYWWVRQYPVTQAAKECEVANGTAVDVYQWLREICSWHLINHDLALGGTGPIHTNIVQIDESCFSHKPKVSHTV